MTHDPTQPVLDATDLHKTYHIGGQSLEVLRGASLSVVAGQWLAIVGRSGSGKSTLLHLLGGLDKPDQGQVRFRGRDVYGMGLGQLDRFRQQHVGFVFQFYHLLPELTALQNVLIAAMAGHWLWTWPGARRDAAERARMLLEQVGLKDRMHHRPAKLSGGERQRVAIARALINEPAVLLADEPTGNLDATTAGQIIELFGSLHESGQAIVMVTHDDSVAQAADARLTLTVGVIHDQVADQLVAN